MPKISSLVAVAAALGAVAVAWVSHEAERPTPGGEYPRERKKQPCVGGASGALRNNASSNYTLTRVEMPWYVRDAVAEIGWGQDASRIEAAIIRWTAEDPRSAAEWVRNEDTIPHTTAVAAVLNTLAGHDVDTAIAVATEFARDDPEQREEYQHLLTYALDSVGAYERAAALVEGGGDFDIDAITLAYSRWGAAQPESAIARAVVLSDPMARHVAIDAAIDGWSQADPKGLVESAIDFPRGPERDFALVTALRAWLKTAPAEASDWMGAHGAALATMPSLAEGHDE